LEISPVWQMNPARTLHFLLFET